MDDLHGHLFCLRGADILGYPPHSAPDGMKWDLWIGCKNIIAINGVGKIFTDESNVTIIDCNGLTIAPGLIDMHVYACGDCSSSAIGNACGTEMKTPEASLSELLNAGITTFVGISGSDTITKTPLSLVTKIRSLSKGNFIKGYVCGGAKNQQMIQSFPSRQLSFSQSVANDFMLIDEMIGRGVFGVSQDPTSNDDSCWNQTSPSDLIKYAMECFHFGQLASSSSNQIKTLFYVSIGSANSLFDPLRDMSLMLPSHTLKFILPTIRSDAEDNLLHDSESWVVHDKGCLNISAAYGVKSTTQTCLHYLSRCNFPSHRLSVSSEAYSILNNDTQYEHPSSSSSSSSTSPKGNHSLHNRTLSYATPNSLLEVIRSLYLDHGVDLKIAFDLISYNPARLLNISHHKGKIAPGYDADILLLDSKDLRLVAVLNEGRFVKCDPGWTIPHFSNSPSPSQHHSTFKGGEESDRSGLLAARKWLTSKIMKNIPTNSVHHGPVHNENQTTQNIDVKDTDEIKHIQKPNVLIYKNPINEDDYEDKENEEDFKRENNRASVSPPPRSPRSLPRSPNLFPYTSPPPPPPRSSKSSPRLTSPSPLSSSSSSSLKTPSKMNKDILTNAHYFYSEDTRHSVSSPTSTVSSNSESPALELSQRDSPLTSPSVHALSSIPDDDGVRRDSSGKSPTDDPEVLQDLKKAAELRLRFAQLKGETSTTTSASEFSLTANSLSIPNKTIHSIERKKIYDNDDFRTETKSEAIERLKNEAMAHSSVGGHNNIGNINISQTNPPDSPTLQSLAIPMVPPSSPEMLSPIISKFSKANGPITSSPHRERGMSPRSSSAGRAESPDRPFHHNASTSGYSIGSGGDTIVEISRYPSLGYETGTVNPTETSVVNNTPNTTQRIDRMDDLSNALNSNGHHHQEQVEKYDRLEECSPDRPPSSSSSEDEGKNHALDDGDCNASSSEEESWEGDMLDFVGRDLMDRRSRTPSIGRSGSDLYHHVQINDQRNPPGDDGLVVNDDQHIVDFIQNTNAASSSSASSSSTSTQANASNRLAKFSSLASNRRNSPQKKS